MNPPSKKQKPLWLVRLLHWEYWPMDWFYLPVYPYLIYLMARARSLTFFTATNPGLPAGGFAGEEKMDILNLLPQELIPQTRLISGGLDEVSIKKLLSSFALNYPVIAKPNIGERGYGVEKINDIEALLDYHRMFGRADYLIQDYAPGPLEAGVLYYRLPGAETGTISSIVLKEMLAVTGDGHSRLGQLIQQQDRARFQLARLQVDYNSRWAEILPEGQRLELVAIGNHSRGTTFIDGNKHINPQLVYRFDAIAKQVKGFYFGRFDLRATSIAALEAGDFKIVELNGVTSEPGHIYDPNFKLLAAYKVLYQHWWIIYCISRTNHAAGVPYMHVAEVLALIRDYRRLHRK